MTPQEKKRHSYRKDRRNTYGECPKSSRKNIARGKRRSARGERRLAREAFVAGMREVDEARMDDVEARVLLKRRKAFRKHPDEPLGEVLARRVTYRARLRMVPEDAAEATVERIRRTSRGRRPDADV